MVKRNEMLVAVRDPKGKIFEVTRRNATDLIQHSGWSYVRPAEPTTDELATAARKRIPRGQKVAESRELAAKQKAEAEAVAAEAPVKAKGKPGRKPKKVALPVYDVDDESDDADLTPFDAAQSDDLEDELDAIEAEEEARIPKELE
jgi:hypothetical protein